jgi:hypothetical protein
MPDRYKEPQLDSAVRESSALLLHRPNMRYLGYLDPAELPWLYRLVDRGFIPYEWMATPEPRLIARLPYRRRPPAVTEEVALQMELS